MTRGGLGVAGDVALGAAGRGAESDMFVGAVEGET